MTEKMGEDVKNYGNLNVVRNDKGLTDLRKMKLRRLDKIRIKGTSGEKCLIR